MSDLSIKYAPEGNINSPFYRKTNGHGFLAYNLGEIGFIKPENKNVNSNGDVFIKHFYSKSPFSFLRSIMGYSVKKINEKNDNIRLSRYNSSIVQMKLKEIVSPFEEQDFFHYTSEIQDYCNLKSTSLKTLPKLKSVGGNLTLDTSSNLEDISHLNVIGGNLNVIAKNKKDMINFLQKIGIMSKDEKILPILTKGVMNLFFR